MPLYYPPIEIEKKIELFFEESPIAQAVVGKEGKLLWVNESFAKLLGYTVLELTRKNFQSITHPEDLDADLEMYNNCLAGNFDGYSMVKRYFSKTGYAMWVKLDVRMIRNSDNEPFFLVWVVPLPNAGKFKVEATPNNLIVKPVIKLSDIIRDNLKVIITIASLLLMSIGGAIVTFIKYVTFLHELGDKISK